MQDGKSAALAIETLLTVLPDLFRPEFLGVARGHPAGRPDDLTLVHSLTVPRRVSNLRRASSARTRETPGVPDRAAVLFSVS